MIYINNFHILQEALKVEYSKPFGCWIKAVVPSARVTAWTVCVSICCETEEAEVSKDRCPP